MREDVRNRRWIISLLAAVVAVLIGLSISLAAVYADEDGSYDYHDHIIVADDGSVTIPALGDGTFDADTFDAVVFDGEYKNIKVEGTGTYDRSLDPGEGYTLVMNGINITGRMYVGDNSHWTLTNCTVNKENKSGTGTIGSNVTLDLDNTEIYGAYKQEQKGHKNYGNNHDISINGGTWWGPYTNGKLGNSKGAGTLLGLSHCRNVKLSNMTAYCGTNGHAIELIACTDVTVDNCTLENYNAKVGKSSVEEPLQIDLATPKNAPNINHAEWDGLPCRNVTVQNCNLTGNRGLCVNQDNKHAKYRKAKNFHSNIVIQNNTVTGLQAEAIVVFNAKNVSIKGNKCYNKSKRSKKDSYSVGINVQITGSGVSSSKMGGLNISGNTAKGGRQAICAFTHTKTKYSKTTVTKNKAYCKAGKSKAINCKAGKSNRIKSNKTYKW